VLSVFDLNIAALALPAPAGVRSAAAGSFARTHLLANPAK
jgi:hypothetical protein